MGTRYAFQKALKVSRGLDPDERSQVLDQCFRIKEAQDMLMVEAHDVMAACTDRCQGMCCRNLDIDSVFSPWDFILILTLKPNLEGEIRARLDNHLFFHQADCPFLENGIGPCIFPDGIKAEVCVATFCSNDPKIKQSVGQINRQFFKLCLLIRYLQARKIFRFFMGIPQQTRV